MFRPFLLLLLSLVASPALAHEGVHIVDAYARVVTDTAKSGAAYFVIENHGPNPDRLLSVTADAAAQAMLHSNVEDANGVMSMQMIDGGIEVPGNATHVLGRAGDHLMLMGLTKPLRPGDIITLTLTFEREGTVVVEAPVDNDRPVEASAAAMPNHDHMTPSP